MNFALAKGVGKVSRLNRVSLTGFTIDRFMTKHAVIYRAARILIKINPNIKKQHVFS